MNDFGDINNLPKGMNIPTDDLPNDIFKENLSLVDENYVKMIISKIKELNIDIDVFNININEIENETILNLSLKLFKKEV
jgi:hypothetical protein